MIPRFIIDNFQPWFIQVLLIGSIGALLPVVFRIRHPRSQLIYCQSVLLICLALPLLQPWKHATISMYRSPGPPQAAASASVAFAPSAGPLVRWDQLILWIVLCGIVLRLAWTLAGLWRLRQHRFAAIPLYPIPESVHDAARRIGVSASFCLSSGGSGPVTFGFVRPVVLLPQSFLSMREDAQCGIVCHELLHVKRWDWLITVIEEILAAFFWYNPGVWWLLGQIRLSREQLVDAEVVRTISDPEPYIGALLKIAEAQTGLDLAPAPLFLRRRHLLQRMHSLVTEVSMSRLRLVSSYGGMILLLGSTVWLGTTLFPLTGLAEVKEAPAPPAAVAVQDTPGYVVNVPPRSYPREAIQKGVEGTVVVELTFNAAGNITDSRVLSGPEELRRTALESALNGTYPINVARTLQVVVNFKLPAAPSPSAVGTVPPPPPAPPQPAVPVRTNVIVDHFDILGLGEPQLSALKSKLDTLVGKTPAPGEIQQAIHDSGAGLPYTITQTGTGDRKAVIALNFGSDCKPVQTPFGPTNPCAVPSPFAPAFATRDGAVATPFGPVVNPPIQTPFGATPTTETVPSPFDSVPFVNNLSPTSTVDPVYPPLAFAARIQGVVLLQVMIGPDGKVSNLRVVTGHPVLIQAAIEAVKQWIYPGQTGSVVTNATVNFKFPPPQ